MHSKAALKRVILKCGLVACRRLSDAATNARAAQLAHAFFDKLFTDVEDVNWEFERAARALLRLQEMQRKRPTCFSWLFMSSRRVQAPDYNHSVQPLAEVEALPVQSGSC